MADEAIKAALDDGGAISLAIKQHFTEALGDEGAVAKAIAESSLRAKAEVAYPFLQHLKGMSVEKYKVAWRSLLTDADNAEHLISSMSDQGVVSVFGLAAAYPANSELQQMKQASIVKSAPKTSLKSLCLPTHGGGPDKVQVFISVYD